MMNKITSFTFLTFLIFQLSAQEKIPLDQGFSKQLPFFQVDTPSEYDQVQSTPIQGDLHPELEAQLTAILDSCISTTGAVAMSAALTGPDGNWTNALGMAADGVPAQASNIFGIGSITKPITSAAIFKLQEAGMLDINDAISLHLTDIDDYEFIDPTIKLYQLLQHTSGIYDYTTHPTFSDSVYAGDFTRIWSPTEILEKFLDEPLSIAGTNWSYCNTNYLLLGLVIEAASGMSYHDYVRTTLLFPHNLEGMALFPYENFTNDHAHIHVDLNSDGTLDDVDAVGFTYQSFFSAAWAAGAYTSSAEDIATFTRLLYSGQILNEASMEQLLAPFPVGALGYGMGVIIVYDAEGNPLLYGHNGAIIYSANAFYLPFKDIAVSLLDNTGTVDANMTYPFMLSMMEACINFVPTSTKEIPVQVQNVELSPNPVADVLNIQYEVKEASNLEVWISDMSGRKIALIENADTVIGKHQITWAEANTLKNGTYIIEFKTDKSNFVKLFVKQ